VPMPEPLRAAIEAYLRRTGSIAASG